MKQTNGRLGSLRTLHTRLRDAPPDAGGILVEEEELGSATAQRMYKMRCECGRSWFELELKLLDVREGRRG